MLLTRHDHEGALRLHGNQAGAEDRGGVGGRDATQAAAVPQLAPDGVEGVLSQKRAPVWFTGESQTDRQTDSSVLCFVVFSLQKYETTINAGPFPAALAWLPLSSPTFQFAVSQPA